MIGSAEDTRHHVVIIGSGFGGLSAVKALRRVNARVTLIDRRNHHLFQPLLYQVATGILSEGQIAPAIRDIFRNYHSLRVVLGEVTGVDAQAGVVHMTELGRAVTVAYDSLIVAAGAETSYFGHDEYRHAASGMKSLDDALFLRGQIFGAFERAEAEDDEARRQALQTFVVIGGGPTGVEMAGQLIELSHRALRRNYRRIDLHATRVVLVEGGGALLASMGGRLSAMTARDLGKIGVEVHVDTMVTGMDTGGVNLTKSDGSTLRIESETKVWAAGTRASPLATMVADATGAAVDRSGRVLVEPDCTVPGHPEIFVVGDMMALNNLAGVAEVAMQSAKHAARTIGRRLKGDAVSRPFHYHDLGTMAAVSRFRAMAKFGPLQIGGLLGWLMWLVVHLTFLTEFKNRFGALARWGVSFVGRGRYERALVGRWSEKSDPPDL